MSDSRSVELTIAKRENRTPHQSISIRMQVTEKIYSVHVTAMKVCIIPTGRKLYESSMHLNQDIAQQLSNTYAN